VIIGDGKHRMKLEERARTLGERARFLGQIPSGAGVRELLDSASLFVLPSRSEGLPRALLEGMARGLPCLASPVGGIPELLPAECLVPVGDSRALAQRIKDLVRAPRLMAEMSAQNVKKAREYHEGVLNPRKIAFYRFLRDETERWLTSGRRAMVTGRRALRGLE
jgi:glycosyltransferase involved in cell wall biosynthesis